MEGRKISWIVLAGFVAVFLQSEVITAQQAGESEVEVLHPARDGVEVGMNLVVEGTARVPSGHHIWVFVRRVDFEPFWWPQSEGKIDPESGQWKVHTTIGAPQDVGWQFDVAVAAFQEDAHVKLQHYRRKGITSGNFPPIEMPEAQAPPKILRVMKISH